MPLTKGQRVVLRDGSLATVTGINGRSSDRTGTADIHVDGQALARPSNLWCYNGRASRDPYIKDSMRDAVADAPDVSEPVKPKLTLPLTVGQLVVRRDDKTVTVKEYDSSYKGSIVSMSESEHPNGQLVFSATGCCASGDRETIDENDDLHNYWDAVADASKVEKKVTISAGPPDWSKPIIGVKQDGTLVAITSHHPKVTPGPTWQRQVNFDENGNDQDVLSPCGARRGFCYLESGVHHRYPDEMPVIRNIS